MNDFIKKFCRCCRINQKKSEKTLKEPLVTEEKNDLVRNFNNSTIDKETDSQNINPCFSNENQEPSVYISENDKDNQLLIPAKYIRRDELDKIVFSQKGILDLVTKVREEFSNGDIIVIWDKDELKIDYKNGVNT